MFTFPSMTNLTNPINQPIHFLHNFFKVLLFICHKHSYTIDSETPATIQSLIRYYSSKKEIKH